ncbi:AGAP012276-PA [Anopheles gambiae str. PEST]|uniref:AGAP012276-PA n=1 Tax=Anopheles gambiae TaxID=7165 RepID=A0A1W5C8V0_ANOGA|nr:AGAP012276-PA [Anopheles gambiae str. PEST]
MTGKTDYACGGSILDENTILTASHCVHTRRGVLPAARVLVHVGQINLKEASEYTQTLGAREIILHPGFSRNSIINDIALIKLSSNITMTKYVQPVCLWTMDSKKELIVGKNGTIVGFGLNEQDVVSERLKQALIGVADALTCIASDRSVFGTHLTSDMFCGKGQKGVSACNGDSGGGMFFEVGGKWFVRGLVSFTPLRGNTTLCDPLKYTAYTDVAKHLEWIKQYIDQRVLSFESDVLDIDYEEKLRLFNFQTCDSAECMKLYAQENIVLNLENKRLCAEIANNQDEQNCNALISGSPLQELKMFGGKEQYFLRGFELLGQACNARAPPIYNNIEAYIDWILYNMRYNEPEDLDMFKTNPLELVVTSNEDLDMRSKTLTALNPTTCQRQLAQEGFLTSTKTVPW